MKQHLGCISPMTSTQSYQVTRQREYGDQETSTRVTALRQGRLFTDALVDYRVEGSLTRKIREAEGKMEKIKKRITNLRDEKPSAVIA
jgi:hypothetical protein